MQRYMYKFVIRKLLPLTGQDNHHDMTPKILWQEEHNK